MRFHLPCHPIVIQKGAPRIVLQTVVTEITIVILGDNGTKYVTHEIIFNGKK